MTLAEFEKRSKILSTDGHVLVLGGPGSGKTTIALQKAAHKIEHNILAGQSVLFLSFSRAAVARLAEASKEGMSRSTRKQIDMHTFHSFCWEIIKSHGYLLGAPKKLKVLLPHDEKSLSGGAKTGSKEWDAWELERERLFLHEGVTAFDLFIPKAIDILVRSMIIRNLLVQKYPLIIVDEAQDTGNDAWRFMELLSPYVQIICLADLEQQIFDHLEGVGPERIKGIEHALKPLIVDLGAENNRSPGTNITEFANDVLLANRSLRAYKGISIRRYDPKNCPQNFMKNALGQLHAIIKKETGRIPNSYAILAPTSSGVARISSSLNSGEKPIPHKVLLDEAEVVLASRFLAFLIEPKTEESHKHDVIHSLELLASIKRARGSKTSISEAEKFLKWAEAVRNGKRPKSNLLSSLNLLIKSARDLPLIGNPKKDWIQAKRLLVNNNNSYLQSIAKDLDYLVTFNRGKKIASHLLEMWGKYGCYLNAKEALNEAITEDAIFSGIEDLSGVHVMTIHRSKGKQFDGVILFRENRMGKNGWESSFVWREDPLPYNRSRKVLRVGITRARCHVLIVEPIYNKCPIISPFNL